MSHKVYNRPYLIYLTRVWWAIFKKSLNKSLSYRTEVLTRLFRTVLVIFTQLVLIQSIYYGGDTIAGWDIYDYYLLVGIFNFVNYFSWGLFNINLWRLEEKILKGEFDFQLLYPTGSVFAGSLIEFHLDDALASLSGILFIAYYVLANGAQLTPVSVVLGVLAIIAAFIMWYSIHLTVASINFLSVKNGLLDLTKSLTRIGSFPIDIFPPNYKFVFYTIFPIAFIASVPARVFTGLYSVEFVIGSFGLALIMLNVAIRIWNLSIKRYTSFGG